MNPPSSLQEQKAFLRKGLREKLDQLRPEERLRRTEKILGQLFKHPRFLKARTILTYMALASEVETRPILEEARKQGKKVYVPRVDPAGKRIWMIEVTNDKEFKPGPYGILEPPFDSRRVGNASDLDLAVIPGLGYDRQGGRLGRGEGYFDRFLKQAKKAYKIGLAFECQVVDRIPRGVDDVAVDEVLMG